MPDTPKRLPWIDALRGLAIILMVPANLAPYFAEPHPMWFRILGSFAAPTFIMLSAGMVVLTGERHSLSYYLKRGGIVLGVGVLLDTLLWEIFPFTSFDVLYTIGISLPLIYILRKVESRELLYLSVIIFLAMYVLQQLTGYHAEPLEVYFEEVYTPSITRILQSWFIDGWFPILPWLGYATLGALFFRTLFRENSGTSNRFLLFGGGLTLAGFALLFIPLPFLDNLADGTILESRGGYSEIFYPPTFAYIFTSIGIVMFFSALLRRMRFPAVSSLLAFFGRHSMMVYILHQVMGTFVVEPLTVAAGYDAIELGPIFTLVNLAVLGGIYAICFGIDMVKERRAPQSTVMQVLFGK